MDNQTSGSMFDPSGIASVAMQAGERLVHELLMAATDGNATTSTTEMPLMQAATTHLNNDIDQHHNQQTLAPTNGRYQSADGAINDLPCFKDLIAVLIECFTIISLGYLSSRFKLISSEAKDLGAYLTTFALPMIIFLNIAQMEFQTINMSFLFCMLISKLLLFILVTLVTLAISYPANFSYAGALSILATQSNDFALGYPLIKSLYGESRPEMLSYLNLMGPIQLLIINPLGIIMLEYEKSRANRRRRLEEATSRRRKECHLCSSNSNQPPPESPGTQQSSLRIEQQVIKTDEQLISSQTRAALRQRSGISSSLVNLAAKENNVDVHGKCSINCSDDNNNNESCPDTSLEDEEDNHRQLVAPRQRMPTAADGGQMKRKNIKSLTLVMPATIMPWPVDPAGAGAAAAALNNSEQSRHLSSDSKPPSSQQVPVARSHSNSPAPSLALVAEAPSSDGSERSVYTRPKLFNIIANSKWPANGSSSSQSGNVRPTANGFAHDDTSTQLQSVLAGDDLDQRAGRCDCFNSVNHDDVDGRPLDATLSADPSPQLAEHESKIDLSFIRALLTNPLIIASVIALAVNLVHGPELPKFVTKVSNTIAASFAAPALFVVGLSMYGKFNLIVRNPNDFLLSSVLVATKVLVLPSIMRTIVMLILPHYAPSQEVPYLADFSYLYGLLPTAPGACIIAKQYEVLTNVVSICMLLSTLISAPLMLATSAVINQAASIKPDELISMVAQTLRASSSVTLVFSLLTLYLLWKTNRRIGYMNLMNSIDRILDSSNRAKATHLFTFLLALTQLIISIGGITWLFVDTAELAMDSADVKSVDQPTAGSNQQAAWPQHDDEELLANEESHTLHNRILTPGPHGFFVAQQATPPDGLGAMCTMQYILSSGGVLMARLIILCIVLTNFAKRYEGHRLGPNVCSLMMKIYPILGIAIILNLVFEAQDLTCSPIEPSLPSRPLSIYTRLAFNTLLLLLAVPLFTATFRLENKAAWLKSQADPTADEEPTALRHRRRFKQSSASLTSETSSAITTSTNLETSLNQQHGANSTRTSTTLRPIVANLDQGVQQQSLVLTLDEPSLPNGMNLEQNHANCDIGKHGNVSCALYHAGDQPNKQVATAAVTIDNPHYAISSIESSMRIPAPACGLDYNQNQDLIRSTGSITADHNTVKEGPQEHQTQIESTHRSGLTAPGRQEWSACATCCSSADFDKYSILIVFMLFQALLNVTSMVQQLSQANPFGTFMLIQLANVALDFGQGLITFLVISLRLVPLNGAFAATTRFFQSSTRPRVADPIV